MGTELLAGADDLSDWAAARGAGLFLPADNAVLTAWARVSQWATTQQYEPVAVNTFFQVADYWLVGHALAHRHIVVTHEVPSVSLASTASRRVVSANGSVLSSSQALGYE